MQILFAMLPESTKRFAIWSGNYLRAVMRWMHGCCSVPPENTYNVKARRNARNYAEMLTLGRWSPSGLSLRQTFWWLHTFRRRLAYNILALLLIRTTPRLFSCLFTVREFCKRWEKTALQPNIHSAPPPRTMASLTYEADSCKKYKTLDERAY